MDGAKSFEGRRRSLDAKGGSRRIKKDIITRASPRKRKKKKEGRAFSGGVWFVILLKYTRRFVCVTKAKRTRTKGRRKHTKKKTLNTHVQV